MSDPTKVYQGGIPGTFDEQIGGTEYRVTNEAESDYVPGKADAPSPKTVNQGGATQGKTYDKTKSEDFLGSSDYQPFSMAVTNWTGLKTDTDNPNDISKSASNDDEDLPKK